MDLYNEDAGVEKPYKIFPRSFSHRTLRHQLPKLNFLNLTFGGIAAAAQQFFHSTVLWHPVSEGVDLVINGEYALGIAPIYSGLDFSLLQPSWKRYPMSSLKRYYLW